VLLFRIRVGRFLAVKNENPFSRAQCDRWFITTCR
jgi:hypothetical protein